MEQAASKYDSDAVEQWYRCIRDYNTTHYPSFAAITNYLLYDDIVDFLISCEVAIYYLVIAKLP